MPRKKPLQSVVKTAQRALAARVAPDEYKPRTPAELIGGARKTAALALHEVLSLVTSHRSLRFLIHGDNGNGKTRVAKMLARALAANAIDIEQIDGPNVSAEVIRRWTHDARYASLFGGWKVKIIPETDLVTPAAQDLMLTYLDELPAQTAIIGTSNKNVALLTERFQTRFRLLAVESPSSEELVTWLSQRWGVPKQQASFIALGACGNVRAALHDAASWLSFGKVEARPKVTESAWKAMRAADLRNKRRSRRGRNEKKDSGGLDNAQDS